MSQTPLSVSGRNLARPSDHCRTGRDGRRWVRPSVVALLHLLPSLYVGANFCPTPLPCVPCRAAVHLFSRVCILLPMSIVLCYHFPPLLCLHFSPMCLFPLFFRFHPRRLKLSVFSGTQRIDPSLAHTLLAILCHRSFYNSFTKGQQPL